MNPETQAIPAGQNEPVTRPWLAWLMVAGLVYLLLAAVGAIGDGFKAAAGDNAKELFAFATNPFVGVMIGLTATALIQSSSTVTSIIVGMVAGGLPIGIAIPLVMGANIGTSLTSTIVALGHVRDGAEFRRAFSAATVHDAFNVTAVLLLLPLELMFHPLQHMAEGLAHVFVGDSSLDMKSVNFMSALLAPASGVLKASVGWLPSETWSGVALILVGIGLILFVVTAIGRILRRVMVGRAKEILHAGVGRGPIRGIGSGMIITMLVQSSSTTTALIVPLAGSGAFTLKQVYPFTLGTNIGTCVTALLAATAISGPTAELAMQIALVHLMFNVLGILLIYGLPFLRGIPPMAATGLAALAQRSKLYVLGYIGGLFFALPLGLITLSRL